MQRSLSKWTPIAALLTAASFCLAPTPSPAQDAARLELGKTVFTAEAEPKCAVCHTLSDAGAAGEIGPSLDDLKPNEARVQAAVTNGIGVMPAYGETLGKEQIAAVAAYVAAVTRKAK